MIRGGEGGVDHSLEWEAHTHCSNLNMCFLRGDNLVQFLNGLHLF